MMNKRGKKRGCSGVASEVANALHDRPQRWSTSRPATFDALEKYKKAIESKQKKEPESRLMPNFRVGDTLVGEKTV